MPPYSSTATRARVSRLGAARSMTTIFVSSPNDAAEAEAEVHRHADHQRDVGLLQRLARAREKASS